VLASAINSIRPIGLNGVMLLFDENERSLNWRIGTNPPKRIISAANLMRRFIDSTINGSFKSVVAIYSILPNFIEIAKDSYAALGQRLAFDNEGLFHPWRWPIIDVDMITH